MATPCNAIVATTARVVAAHRLRFCGVGPAIWPQVVGAGRWAVPRAPAPAISRLQACLLPLQLPLQNCLRCLHLPFLARRPMRRRWSSWQRSDAAAGRRAGRRSMWATGWGSTTTRDGFRQVASSRSKAASASTRRTRHGRAGGGCRRLGDSSPGRRQPRPDGGSSERVAHTRSDNLSAFDMLSEADVNDADAPLVEESAMQCRISASNQVSGLSSARSS